MLLSAVSVLASLHLAALADAISQCPIHNLTQALLQNGMPAHAIPQSKYLSKGGINGSCAAACFSLHQTFGDTQVESRSEPIYNATINYYWSAQQREARPQCIFKPEKALDVATLVLLSQITGCPFAARSGGHAAFAGASNVNGGITMVFERMKDITLSGDKRIASIGPGSIWYDIYTRLAKDNLAVVGGRVAALGIGGLTTGGGISFFANQYGWACDNVASYEVVLADGRIVTAKPNSSFSDLYWALRGGGNNLGIVTRFDLTTFVHGPLMFGGHRIFLNTSFSSAIDAFVNLGNKAADDTKATQILSVALDPTSGTRVAVAELEYADAVQQPPILEEYRRIPAISDTLQLNTLANLTKTLNDTNPKGFRESYWTASSNLDRNMVDFAFHISFKAFDTVRDIPGILPANSIQVITVPQLEQMQKNGGNALGLSPSDGPILFLNINFRWNNEQDDERVLRACAEIVTKFKQEAKRRNLENKYLYMNYASQFQDVIGSYGESAERLRQVAKSYDPNGVFQVLQPGYFKLWGALSREEAGALV